VVDARRLDPWLGLAVAGAAALRLVGLGSQSLWYDEWLTAEATSGGLRDLAHHVVTREGITPPYFVVMWAWARIVGDGDIALRVPSVIVGVVTVPVAYAIARALGQRRTVARVAAALVAVNPMLVWYSQEARPYSLLAFLGALSVLACVRARERPDRGRLAAWALAAAAVAAVHYFALFLVAGEAIVLVAAHRRRWGPIALACLPTAVVTLALVPFAVRQASHAANRDWIGAFSLTSRVEEAGRSALLGPSLPAERLWLLTAVLVALAAALVVAGGTADDRRAAGLLVALGAAAVAVPLLVSLAMTDVFLGRYLIAGLVPLIVAVAVGFGVRRHPALGLAGAAAAVALGVASVWTVGAVVDDPGLQRPDWRAVAAATAEGDGPSVLVLNVGSTMSSPLDRYLPGSRRLGPDEEVRVARVDVLTGVPAHRPCNMLVGNPCGFVFLGAPLPPDLAPQFAEPEDVPLDQFAIRRYRADHPVPVTAAALLAPADPAGAAVWLVPR
jgi:mannosyltransferase